MEAKRNCTIRWELALFNADTTSSPMKGPAKLPHVESKQNLSSIPNWEIVVAPLVDYLHNLPDVDHRKIGLVALSFGALLAARAAAFERRLAAVILIDGLYDFPEAVNGPTPHSSPLRSLNLGSRQRSTRRLMQ